MKIVVGFLLALWGLAAAEAAADPLEIDPWTTRVHFENDFEDEVMSPWFDQSAARVIWQVERLDSPSEVDSPAPPPTAGTKYLRATRDANLNSGLAVLHSPVFTALPGDRVDFSFWIRSRQPQANNLELYYVENNKETLLISLSQFSFASNFEWRNASVDLPFNQPTDISLIFYGFCGSNPEDAIGLDNIVVGFFEPTTQSPTTTSVSTSTTSRPNCNAVLNAESTSFSSPNFPDQYDNNLNCNWLIVTPSGTRISLSFVVFTTQPDSDVLRIYDGGSTSSPLLANFSGTSSPPSVQSSDNVMLVTFTTDNDTIYRGFLANYHSYRTTDRPTTEASPTTTSMSTSTTPPPNCSAVLNAESKLFGSPNFPDNYGNNLNCNWLIVTPSSTRISLSFTVFSTQPDYDVLRIYDGGSTSSPLLGSFSGGSSPPSLQSCDNVMLVTFTTDSAITNRGFLANYHSYGATDRPTAYPTTEASTTEYPSCQDSYLYQSGYLSSPNYPSDYPNSADCYWYLDSTGSSIGLNLYSFSTEQCCDYVQVFEGWSTSGTELIYASGGSIPTSIFTTRTSKMLVHFHSDGSVTGQGFRAFFDRFYAPSEQSTADWTVSTEMSTDWQTTPPSTCGNNVTGNTGELTSPNYPNIYPNDFVCNTVIRVSTGYRVHLTFTDLNTELNYDYLNVYDRSTDGWTMVMTTSGTSLPTAVTSSTNEVLVRFITDISGNSYRGWRLTYSAY